MTRLCQQSQTHACRTDLFGREVGRKASTIPSPVWLGGGGGVRMRILHSPSGLAPSAPV